MGKLTLLLAIHNHQPDGNFDHVFQRAFRDCYQPLLTTLSEFPFVRVALHHTGALYEWIEREHPEYFALLRSLVARGQVELLGGGFYEPMLAVLPERDARGQIAFMSDYTFERFGARPVGMWLAERVWEPSLAKLIAETGMRFTLVDDGHFRYAGMEGLLRGYYVTEKAGVPLAMFPIDKKLRDAIPFAKAWETIAALEQLQADSAHLEGDQAVTYGDDGEKFGVWPHTKEWVWEKGWLREFFKLLGEKQDRIVTQTFTEYLNTHPPTGRVYLPTASYEEMGEWTLPADAQGKYLDVRKSLESRSELERARPFIRGGIWQNFLAKYPEANFMHKKMIFVSDKLARAEAVSTNAPHELLHARRELYRAQCNCAYWHGLFGGLYLNSLRDAVYHHLIEAELDANRILGAAAEPDACELRDIDADLRPEILLTSDDAAVYVKPDRGGSVFELDYRPKRFNLLNILGRRAEGYHGRLLEATKHKAPPGSAPLSIHELTAVKSDGLEELLVYDRFPRGAFVDHFVAVGTRLDHLASGRYDELGDFAGGTYEIVERRGARVTLRRAGKVAGREVTIEKAISLDGARLECRYRLSFAGERPAFVFAPEVDLTLLAGDAPDRYYRLVGGELAPSERKLVSRGETPAGAPLELVNEWDQFVVRVSASPKAPLWRFPIETASQSEGGFERTYQASVIVPTWRSASLEPTFEASVTIEVRPL